MYTTIVYVGLKDQLTTFFASYPVRTYSSGSIIIYAGDQPNGIYFIESGLIRQYFISKQGTEFSIMLHKPGSLFPLPYIFSHNPSDTFFEAMSPEVQIHIAPVTQVHTFLQKNPSILFELFKKLALDIELMEKFLEFEVLGDAYIKLAFSLYILVKQFGKKQADGKLLINLKMTQLELASFSALTHETVNRKLMELKKHTIVEIKDSYLIVSNYSKLEELLQIH